MPTSAEQAIYNRLASAPTFHPASAKLLPTDWTLEPGDVVTVKSGETSYAVPVYSMDLTWNANSQNGTCESATTRISVESTGGQTREPLSELKRQQYDQDKNTYSQGRRLASSILAAESILRLEMHATESALSAYITFSASELKTELYAADSRLGSYISQTATSITQAVYNAESNMASYVMQTASEIRSEVYAADSRLGTYISQTATSINQAVYNSVSNLKSSISQQADRISLVVEGTGSNAKIKSAQIVAGINNSGSTVIISADHINLDGYVKASDITADYLKAKIATIPKLEGIAASFTGNITTTSGVLSYQVYSGESDGSQYYNISNPVMDVQLSGPSDNTYTLQYKKAKDTTWQNAQSFSRATTLSGAWSSGTFTVSASPQGNSINTQLVQGSTSWDGTTVTIGIDAIDSDNPNYQYATGRSVTANYSGGGGEHDIRITASIRGNNPPVTTEIFADAGAYEDLHNARAGYYTFKVTCGDAEKWYYFRVGNP